MAILSFTVLPEGLGKVHDALVCLGKFNETVSIEATRDKFILNAFNSTKSAYASFTLVGQKFFQKYHFQPKRAGKQVQDTFTCKIYNKALLYVFKSRMVDPAREKDTAIERCEVSIEDGERDVKSRFKVKIICRHGVIKIYRLTFEPLAPMHAKFDRDMANNSWAISSKVLREFVEHFGPGTEQLDINSDEGRVSFTSYTEKIMAGNEMLKQPLRTTIAVDTSEFGEFSVPDKLHIVISVKDFKAIVTHASNMNIMVRARYSQPCSPMQLSYSEEGILTEFILMTVGESRSTSATPARDTSRQSSKRPPSRQPLEATSSSKREHSQMLPPPTKPAPSHPKGVSQEASQARTSNSSFPPPQPSMHHNDLFLPRNDEDQRWEPANFDEDDDTLQWDKNIGRAPVTVNFGRRLPDTTMSSIGGLPADADLPPTQRLLPTQRLSGIRGMFDP